MLPRLSLFFLDLEDWTTLGARVVDFEADDVTIGVMTGRCGTMTGRTTLLSFAPTFTFKTTTIVSSKYVGKKFAKIDEFTFAVN